jgi:hypothetical protein
MKIIFSRKGFDSASGGTPSPIWPDGRMLSLPIPDNQSPIRYHDIKWHEYDLGKIVSELTGERIRSSYFAHLDPDIRRESLPRVKDWRPLFGQTGSAQSHLRNCGVQPDDVFLFFGLFRGVLFRDEKLKWNPSSVQRHVIWGWLQVGEVLEVDTCNRGRHKWASYHPHFHRAHDTNNTLYVARTNLSLPNETNRQMGAGAFENFSAALQLTAPGAASASVWELPKWFYPKEGRRPLTYHGDLSRWKIANSTVKLNVVARGQEFVLDCAEYPEALVWAQELLTRH